MPSRTVPTNFTLIVPDGTFGNWFITVPFSRRPIVPKKLTLPLISGVMICKSRPIDLDLDFDRDFALCGIVV